MNASFHTGNRKRLYEAMKPASLLVMFSGEDVRKTNDEYYPFYTDRNFYYLTGLDQHELVLMAVKEPSGNVHEQIYILPPDLMAERWTGARLKPAEVEALSGISDVRFVDQFQTDFHALAAGGHYSHSALYWYSYIPGRLAFIIAMMPSPVTFSAWRMASISQGCLMSRRRRRMAFAFSTCR